MAKRKTVKICILLPAFNEAAVIRQVLKDLPKSARIAGRQVTFQTVVVDDGSTDTTAKIAGKVTGVRIVKHLINMGPGAATRTGLHYARNGDYDFALTMDADGQHAASDIAELVGVMLATPSIDLLIGGRLSGSGNMPLHKKIGNRLLSYTTFVMFGAYVSDSQSGFRVYSKRALDTLTFYSNGYVFCSEMLWQAKRAKLQLAEHPIQAIYTEYSKAKGQKSYSGAIKIMQQLVSRRIMELLA